MIEMNRDSVVSRGQRIAYAVSAPNANAPWVVLLHGLFSRGERWAAMGYVQALNEEFRVVCIDSLGHGRSAKPHDPRLYALGERVRDVVAVMDALGAEHAHVVGYSMGAWLASGFALHHPERLASLTLGGWDPVGGPSVPRGSEGQPPPFSMVLAGVRAALPELVSWVGSHEEPAVRACYDALFESSGVPEALASLQRALLLWCGAADDCCDSVRAFGDASSAPCLVVPGDHAQAITAHVRVVAARLLEHFRVAR